MPNPEDLSSINAALSAFLEKNPKSEVQSVDLGGRKINAVTTPWGDSSMVLEIPEDPSELFSALENLILPERLAAIYHRDSRKLEVIWTAYRVPPPSEEVLNRAFTFRYEGADFNCVFDVSSDRLLTLAASFVPVGPPEFAYRNLPSFKRFTSSSKTERQPGPILSSPWSFWVANIDFEDEDALVDFLTNLNFYISYYDDSSPYVLIAPPVTPKGASAPTLRYRHDRFPATILSRSIDQELLQFWSACQTNDPARSFLYSYRIIEHAAFFYIESAPRVAVKKVLLSPHALDNVDEAANQVIAAVRTSKIDDYQKIEHLVLQSVDPKLVWNEIKLNTAFFSKRIVFDGGFELLPLIAGKDSEKEFLNSGIKNFCNVTRKIRNALSHGKEDRSATVITPTSSNYEKLRPWASLMKLAAGEVMVYEAS